MTERRALALLTLLLLAPLWPLWTGQILLQHDLFLSDLLHAVGPYRDLQGAALAAGEFPLWLPEIFSGLPFAGQIEAGVYYVPNWPLFALFPAIWATNFSVLLHVWIGGVGTFRLARLLGSNAPGAVLAGLAFGLCGFNIAHFRHLNLHEASAWLPWLWWALVVALRGDRRGWWALAGGIGLQALAGHPQISYYSALFLGLLATREAVRQRRPGPLFGLLGAGLLGGLLATVALLPAFFLSADTVRAGGHGWGFASAFHLHPADLLFFVNPLLRGSPYDCTYASPDAASLPWANYAYLGALPLLLAFSRLAERKERRWFLLLGTMLLFAMGSLTPLFGLLWSVVPGMQLFRLPNRVLMCMSLILAVLAGRGFTDLKRQGWVAVALLALTSLELGVFHRSWIPSDPDPVWSEPSDLLGAHGPGERVYTLAAFHQWDKAWRRSCETGSVAPYRELAGIPLANNAASLGWESAAGYVALPPRRAHWFWGYQGRKWLDDPPPLPELEDGILTDGALGHLRRGAVTHLVSETELTLPELSRQGRFRLYRLDGVPRAYVSEHWGRVDGLASAAERIRCPGRAPLVESAHTDDGCPADAVLHEAQVERVGNNTVRIQLPGTPGLLVLAESWAPGWTASVDGAPAQVHIVNGYQRGVFVSDESSEVVLRYWPPGLSVGLATTSGALLVWLALGVVLARRERSTPQR